MTSELTVFLKKMIFPFVVVEIQRKYTKRG